MSCVDTLLNKSDVSAINNQIATIQSQISGLATKTDIAGIASTLAQINSKLDRIESNQTTITQRLDKLESGQQSINSSLSSPNWLQTIISSITNAFGSIVQRVWDGLQSVGSAIATTAERLWSGLQGVGQFVVDKAQWVWDKISDAAGFLSGKVGEAIQWVGDRAQWVGSKVENAAQFVLNGVQGIGSIVTNSAQFVWDKVENAAQFVLSGVQGIGSIVTNSAQFVWDKIESVSGFLTGKIGEVVGVVVNKAQWLWDALTNGFSRTETGLSNLLSPVSWIQEWLRETGGKLWDFQQKLWELQGRVWNVIGGINEWIRDRIWDGIQWLWNQITNNGATGGNDQDSICVALTEKIDDIYSAIIPTGPDSNALIEKIDDIYSAVVPTGPDNDSENTAVNYIKEQIDKLTGFVLGGLDSQGNLTTNFENELKAMVAQNFSNDMMTSQPNAIANLKEMILAIAAVSYGRAGYQDYPISVPSLPLDSGLPPLSIPTASRFQSWQTRFIDNGIGMFPFEVSIKDSDLIQVGNQTLNLKFPNIAETLAEIFGLLVVDKSLTETNSQVGFKCLAELGALRKQGYLTYKLNAAITSYLGFKTKQKKEKISLSFNPLVGVDGSEDRIAEALKPKSVDVVIEVEDEKISLEEKLAVLMEAAAITKGVNFEKLTDANKDDVIQHYKDLADTTEEDSEFDVFLEEFERGFTSRPNITDQLNPYGRAYSRRPRVKEIGIQNDADPTPPEGQP